jgi:hypothetical protein
MNLLSLHLLPLTLIMSFAIYPAIVSVLCIRSVLQTIEYLYPCIFLALADAIMILASSSQLPELFVSPSIARAATRLCATHTKRTLPWIKAS